VRAVLDPNVVISGAISPRGAPAEVLRSLARGEFELVASQGLLDELQRALAIRSCGPISASQMQLTWCGG